MRDITRETGHAALYHRVSTLDQDPTLARRELRAAAGRLGLRAALEVEETGSGARNDRPGLRRVMEAARRGDIDAVLVWKLDRFGRSALDVLANIRELEGSGVRFLVTTQGIDVRPGGDALSHLIVTTLAAVAEFERDLIRERTRLGLERARACGVRLGRPPKPGRPSRADVVGVRRRGLSWTAAARALRCPVSTLRRIASNKRIERRAARRRSLMYWR
jgi:putative DNA-invertase from lambdoid prophage Rac